MKSGIINGIAKMKKMAAASQIKRGSIMAYLLRSAKKRAYHQQYHGVIKRL